MEQILVKIGDEALSSSETSLLVATSLGSCLGVGIYDPKLKMGGMAHCLLPLSAVDPAKAAKNPTLYVDTGVVHLLSAFLGRGSKKKDLIITVAGGANMNDVENIFEIGKKNYTVLRKVLWKNDLLIKGEDVGSNVSRIMTMEIATGTVTVTKDRETTKIY